MQVFQLIHDGIRVGRLYINCTATNEQIAESLLAAAVSFKLAGRYEELDGERYCGMSQFERIGKSGSLAEVVHVPEEGGEHDG
jgi:hypothetical protein